MAGFLLHDVLIAGPISSRYRWCHNSLARRKIATVFSSGWGSILVIYFQAFKSLIMQIYFIVGESSEQTAGIELRSLVGTIFTKWMLSLWASWHWPWQQSMNNKSPYKTCLVCNFWIKTANTLITIYLAFFSNLECLMSIF